MLNHTRDNPTMGEGGRVQDRALGRTKHKGDGGLMVGATKPKRYIPESTGHVGALNRKRAPPDTAAADACRRII